MLHVIREDCRTKVKEIITASVGCSSHNVAMCKQCEEMGKLVFDNHPMVTKTAELLTDIRGKKVMNGSKLAVGPTSLYWVATSAYLTGWLWFHL